MEEQLKHYFGYNAFRPHQKEIISACMENRDVVAVLPTGAGKSICYQLPAMLKNGTAIIVSPLISLMQDQVNGLSKSGLPAALLNSSLTPAEMQAVMGNLSKYKLLYVAPERFSSKEFLERLGEIEVSLFAIDEAHCISQWGHSFRPEYRQLTLLKQRFPETPIMALTATATVDVERDIMAQLTMKKPLIVRSSFDRPNLTFRIYHRENGRQQLLSFLKAHQNQSGVVYAATRNTVEETYSFLEKQGFTVGKYHGGLSDQERMQSQHDFLYGECPLMVATVAFGMGVHKPDIRFIVHMDMPRSIEQYYQEVGRAGRDGLAAECLLLYSVQELKVYEKFLSDVSDEMVREQTQKKTYQMLHLCRSHVCRRKELLRYFGEVPSSLLCTGCDICLDKVELEDVTVIAQKILSCVYRMDQKFGVKQVIDVLRGQKTMAILQRGHDRLSTFNLLPDLSETDLRYYMEMLIDKGLLTRSEGEYPVLRWTEVSRAAISGKVPLLVRKKPPEIKPIRTRGEKGLRKSKDFAAYEPVTASLYDHLVQLRRKIAKEAEVPAFIVFADRTLLEMSRQRPLNQAEFLAIDGIGAVKWHRYGQDFLRAILDWQAREPANTEVFEDGES